MATPGRVFHAVLSATGFANHGSAVDFTIYLNGGWVAWGNAVAGQGINVARGWTDVVPSSGVMTVTATPTIACGWKDLRADFLWL